MDRFWYLDHGFDLTLRNTGTITPADEYSTTEWQRIAEPSTGREAALVPDISAHRPGETSGDGKTKANPQGLSGITLGELLKILEHLPGLLIGDSRTIVRDDDQVLVAQDEPLDHNQVAPELASVLHENSHDLLETTPVGKNANAVWE